MARSQRLIAAVALTALAGSIGIELLGGVARDAQDVRSTLIGTTALVNRHSALEWQAVAAGERDAELWTAMAANDAAISSASAALLASANDDRRLASFTALVAQYRAAVGTMTDELRRGDVERAQAIDAELVDPIFEEIHTAAYALLPDYAATAESLSTLSRIGTIALLIAAALAVALLARRATRREAEERIEARFRSLVQNSSDLVTIIDAGGSVTYESPSFRRLLGHLNEETVGFPYAMLVHPDDLPRLERLVAGARHRNGTLGEVEMIRMAHADGSWHQFETVARNLEHDPDVAGIVLTARDTTERERLVERVRHQAAHDELTGLPNRKSFLDQVEAAIAHPGPLAVMFLDLDDFKSLNDNLGHGVGDRVLRVIAERARVSVRPSDLAARLGGDEFGFLVPGVETDTGAQVIADRILEAVSAPINLDGVPLRLSASVGIAIGRSGGHSADLLGEADLAMYAAKRAGKGQSAFFEPSLLAAARERLELHRELVAAIENGEFVVHYQPIVSLPDGAIEGTEALVRWIHPTRGLIPPASFIPLAEDTGLIGRIGEWVLQEAAESTASWRRTRAGRGLTVSVNVSAWQLADSDFSGRVSAILEDAGLPAWGLVLEITESVFADPSPALTANLEGLRALGVQVAIDDFGTGYSSLGYLPRLPVDILKIDRVFVAGPDGSSVDPALPAAIIQMATALGLRTVAEGVESEAQLERMHQLGCQMAQGYVLSRPVPAEAMGALLENGRLVPTAARVRHLTPVTGLAS